MDVAELADAALEAKSHGACLAGMHVAFDSGAEVWYTVFYVPGGEEGFFSQLAREGTGREAYAESEDRLGGTGT